MGDQYLISPYRSNTLPNRQVTPSIVIFFFLLLQVKILFFSSMQSVMGIALRKMKELLNNGLSNTRRLSETPAFVKNTVFILRCATYKILWLLVVREQGVKILRSKNDAMKISQHHKQRVSFVIERSALFAAKKFRSRDLENMSIPFPKNEKHSPPWNTMILCQNHIKWPVVYQRGYTIETVEENDAKLLSFGRLTHLCTR